MNSTAEAFADASADDPAAVAADDNHEGYFLILGETKAGNKFRPSDWADRLFGACGSFARDSDLLDELPKHLCLTERDGKKGIIFSDQLRDIEPVLYHFLHKFASNNNLRVARLSPRQWNPKARRLIIQPKRNFD